MNNYKILVTGGTGSFGQAFVNKLITDYKPARLVIFSRDEMGYLFGFDGVLISQLGQQVIQRHIKLLDNDE